MNEPAIRSLVLAMNRQQLAFEYEFLPFDPNDTFLAPICANAAIDYETTRQRIPEFVGRYEAWLCASIKSYELQEEPPAHYVIISTALFANNYLSLRSDVVSVIALGRWERTMAPPSLAEFILTLLVRESLAAASPRLKGSVHLGTKGCVCDFHASLREVRDKVLCGYLCSTCGASLVADGLADMVPEVETLARKQWLGRPDEPGSPAAAAFNLGYDLFVTKGLRSTPWESFKSALSQEGAKQVATLVGGILLAALILVLA